MAILRLIFTFVDVAQAPYTVYNFCFTMSIANSMPTVIPHKNRRISLCFLP